MGAYDTKGGGAIDPEDAAVLPTKLVEDVLALLEDAGIDDVTTDQVAKLIEAAEERKAQDAAEKADYDRSQRRD
jgi:hypothetical protein